MSACFVWEDARVRLRLLWFSHVHLTVSDPVPGLVHYPVQYVVNLNRLKCAHIAVHYLAQNVPYPRGPGAGRTYHAYVIYIDTGAQTSQVARFGARSGSPQ